MSEKSYSKSYKEAGVDITAGYKAVELMKGHIARTKTNGVMSSVGGFGGLFSLGEENINDAVLVSGTDGVGTKLKIAFLMDKHDTVGIDCVAMCVNDIICSGAKPLFFLDYIALGKNIPERVAAIVSGVAEGCVQSACALIGGETAEMPGFYPVDEYDLAGFSVGIVDRKNILSGENIKAGDVIIALPSSGVHSNGFSLVRKTFSLETEGVKALDRHYDDLGMTLGEALLAPTNIYVKPALVLCEKQLVNAFAHITGGGFYENIPRALPNGIAAKIEKRALKILPIFDMIKAHGNIEDRDMFNTFNMGVGMIAVVSKENADAALNTLRINGTNAYIIGETTEGEGVTLC